MNLTALENRANKLFEQQKAFQSANYKTTRDVEGNLIINYQDGEVNQLPLVPFRSYQIDAQKALFLDHIKRLFLVRPRRAGKEVESWNLLIEGAVESPGLYLMIYPTNVRAKAVLWDGQITLTTDTTLSNGKVLKKGSSLKFLDMIPKKMILRFDKQEMKIYLINGSVIWVLGSDIDPDKLRGTNPRGVVRSEAAFGDPQVYFILLPVLRQNGGWMINQSTYNGLNHFHDLGETIKDQPEWYFRVDSILTLLDKDGIPYVSEEMVEEDRRSGMPEYLIQQEYYSVVQLNEESMYFAHQMKHIKETERVVTGLILEGRQVFAFWDIGVNDCMVLLLVQFDSNNKPVIIKCIEDNNKNINYYVDEARRWCIRHGLSLRCHYVPHDGSKRDAGSGGDTYKPKSFVDQGRELGEEFYVVSRPLRKLDAITSMRKMLYHVRFNKEETQRLIICLSNYGKEYDEKHKVYKDIPSPKWSTHCVDAFQTLTLAVEGDMVQNSVHDVMYMPD